MTREEWGGCVLLLRGTYAESFSLDRQALEVWYELLSNYPGAAVIAAVRAVCREVEAFPRPAHIVARIAVPGRLNAEEAWEEAFRAAADGGLYPRYIPTGAPRQGQLASPNWSNDHIRRTVAVMGGLRAISESTPATIGTLRAQFLKVYAGLAAGHAQVSLPEPAMPLLELPAPAAARPLLPEAPGTPSATPKRLSLAEWRIASEAAAPTLNEAEWNATRHRIPLPPDHGDRPA